MRLGNRGILRGKEKQQRRAELNEINTKRKALIRRGERKERQYTTTKDAVRRRTHDKMKQIQSEIP